MTGHGSAPRRRFNVRVPMRDGINLAADVTLPENLPAPAVVMRTPYGKGDEVPSKRAEQFAAGGYVFVTADVRGRGDSDGTFLPYRNDGRDGCDVIEWAAAQEWCSGGVASFGGSYPGQIQYLAALERPPSLRAMVVMVTPSDPFVENPTGVPSPMDIPVVSSDVYEIEVAMWDTAQRVSGGQRLRLDIASAAFPKHEVNFGTGGDIITETSGVLATNALWHDRERPSRLILLSRPAR